MSIFALYNQELAKLAAYGTTARKDYRNEAMASGASGAVLGGAAGAAVGAWKQYRKNKKDPENKQSVGKAALKGGAIGATLGGVAAGADAAKQKAKLRGWAHSLVKGERNRRLSKSGK